MIQKGDHNISTWLCILGGDLRSNCTYKTVNLTKMFLNLIRQEQFSIKVSINLQMNKGIAPE